MYKTSENDLYKYVKLVEQWQEILELRGDVSDIEIIKMLGHAADEMDE